MNSSYTAITKQDNGWWIGWVEELPGVNAQERTKEALLV
jgi:predicted RNase H-like HicB family nuclease